MYCSVQVFSIDHVIESLKLINDQCSYYLHPFKILNAIGFDILNNNCELISPAGID